MPLPSVHRFYNEDYQGSPVWFQKFIGALNLFSDPLYNTVNRGLSFPANFNAQVYSFQIRAGASPDLNTAHFTTTVAGKASGVISVACNLASDIQAPTVGHVDSWYQSGANIFITSISGLTNNTLYNVTVLVF